MAILIQLRTGRRASLSAHTLVGRGPECRVRLSGDVVSATHAALRWGGKRWFVRDLGSRNGTWLDGRQLRGGEEADLVRGAILGFGGESDPWALEDAGAPVAAAVRMGDGARVEAAGSVLLLPDDESPLLAIIREQDASWRLDTERGDPVEDGDLVKVDGERWRLELPRSIDPTVRAEQATSTLRFHVSSDEESVDIEVVSGDVRTRLGHRSFHYLLLTLSRLRAADAELPESRRGWVDQSDLARMLRITHATVNVHLSRARKAVGEVRDDLATRIVERRRGTSQLRFGLEPGEIERE